MLVDDPWSKHGGCGKRIEDVRKMTLDQIYFHLADRESMVYRRHGVTPDNAQAELKPSKDGYIPGRDAQGNPIRAKIGQESLAARIAREEREKREAAQKAEKKKKRRRWRNKKPGAGK